MSNWDEQLDLLIRARTPIIWIRSNEEELIHLQVTCNNDISIGNNGNILVTIKNGKNNNQMIALAIRLNVILKSAAETLNLPYTYSKQYFTLLPNESLIKSEECEMKQAELVRQISLNLIAFKSLVEMLTTRTSEGLLNVELLDGLYI